MMERKKILDEGLLEKYLLDELNESEKARVERAINSDDVLKKQFQELEADFEKMALENAIIPPTIVKDKLKEQLEPKIVRKLWNTPLLVAASISALFFFTSIWMYTQWQNSRSNFESLQNQTTDLQERLNTLEKNYKRTANHSVGSLWERFSPGF
jgi:cytochrome c-type biogenesis protein CcmH/NrfG